MRNENYLLEYLFPIRGNSGGGATRPLPKDGVQRIFWKPISRAMPRCLTQRSKMENV